VVKEELNQDSMLNRLALITTKISGVAPVKELVVHKEHQEHKELREEEPSLWVEHQIKEPKVKLVVLLVTFLASKSLPPLYVNR